MTIIIRVIKLSIYKMKINCEYCNKVVDKYPSYIKKRKHHFCDRKCKGMAIRKRIKVVCNKCGKMFEKIPSTISERNFCSKMCCVDKITIKCKYCDKSISRTRAAIKKIKHPFCNQKCYHKFLREVIKGNPRSIWQKI